ncbi:MAG: preprotein translocase subunit TatC, partial [Bacteroidia bacterium]|nr:preprotein translocase subunit TatC [Bacteroidia bacterium]
MALDQLTNEELEKRANGQDEHSEDSEMSFLDHLEVLRWHLIRSIAAIFVFTTVAFVFGKFLFQHVIFAPSRADFWTYRALCDLSRFINSSALCIDSLNFDIQSRHMSGQFMMHITASMIIGLVCAFPYVFWEIWRFVKPGLYRNERKVAQGATFYVSLLFGLGILFGYYVVAP